MLYLVDGYNVTRSDPATRDLDLQEQREALLARLRTRGRDLLGAGRIVVVFDARDGLPGGRRCGGPPQVVFAHERSADDEIVRIAAASSGKIVVISDDRELVARVAVHASGGAEGRPASACHEAAATRRHTGRRASVARDAGLPPGAKRITRELEELWLNEDE